MVMSSSQDVKRHWTAFESNILQKREDCIFKAFAVESEAVFLFKYMIYRHLLFLVALLLLSNCSLSTVSPDTNSSEPKENRKSLEEIRIPPNTEESPQPDDPTASAEDPSSLGTGETILPEEAPLLALSDERELNICEQDGDCMIVSYSHCCGSTKRAIHKKYALEYENHPEWQEFSDPEVCADIGLCPSDIEMNATICAAQEDGVKRCELVLPTPLETEPENISSLSGTIDVYSDFQCPYCRRFEQEVLIPLQEKHPQITVNLQHFPLAMHPSARPAAHFSICAEQQGKEQEINQRLFTATDLSTENMKAIAAELEIDLEALETCLNDPATDAAVNADISQGRSLGVSGTPTFFINGVKYEGLDRLENVERYLKSN